MTDENDYYYEPSQEEIWYEDRWGDESFYGKGGKHKGKGKYPQEKGRFSKGYEAQEYESHQGFGKGKKSFGKSKMPGKDKGKTHVAGETPAVEGAEQAADGTTWKNSP